MVRMVLPLAAGAVLAPPAWAAVPTATGMREAVPIRVVLSEAVVREEGLLEGEIGHAGSDSEVRVAKAFKTGTRKAAAAAGPTVLPREEYAITNQRWSYLCSGSGGVPCPTGWSLPHSPRAPPG